MSSDKPQESAIPNDATRQMPTGTRPGSTLHSYAGGWQPPTVEQMQAMLPQYQFIEMLGAGGMGAVYKAMQSSLDRLVAIKILPPGLEDGSGANFTERFKQEAKTMAKMSHPCIVNVYDFGQTEEGQFYFVMEFIEGTDVQKMIRANKRLKPEDALAITVHVCDALEYAHQMGVIHRDIKPANVLISANGQVKIADFGLAKAVDNKSHELTRSHMAMGTPHFMAPEAMFADVKVDARADLYAVGVMLYNMLTGDIPAGVFKMPSQKTNCDPRLDEIVKKAMEADRDARYQHASEIRQALDTILTTPVETASSVAFRGPARAGTPADSSGNTDSPASKSGPGMIIGIIMAVAVVVVGVFAWSPWRKKEIAIAATNPAPLPAVQTQGVSQAATAAPEKPTLKPVALPPGGIDLLANVDVKRDSFFSPWTMENGTLKSPRAQRGGENYETIQFPVRDVPSEYDIRLRLRREEEGLLVRIFFVKGDKGGSVCMDSKGRDPVSVEETDREKRDRTGPGMSRTKLFMPGETHEVVVQVRNAYVAVLFDGTEMARSPEGRWKTTQYIPGNPISMAKPPFIGVTFCQGALSVLAAELHPVASKGGSNVNPSAGTPVLSP